MESLEKEKKYIIFDKETGVIHGLAENEQLAKGLNKDLFVFREELMGPGDYFFGDYASGGVFNKEQKPLVFEKDLLNETYNEILKHYPLFKQINIIMEVIDNNPNLNLTESYKKFKNFIKLQKTKLQTKVKHLSADKEAFSFVSNDDLLNATIKNIQMVDRDLLRS